MIEFLRKWFKQQLSYFAWTYIPLILTIVFGAFIAHYFPDIAMRAIGLFIILMLITVFLFSK